MDTATKNVVEENSAIRDEHLNLETVKILAWDYSRSTRDDEHYHRHGKRYLQEFLKTFEPVPDVDITQDKYRRPIYLVWSTRCAPTSLAVLENICKHRKGKGKTNPSTIVSWIHINIPKGLPIELWLITDGEIDSEELTNCSLMNIGVNYCRINFIILNRCKINMSVGASFFRGAKLRIFYNEHLLKEINTSKPFPYGTISIYNFDAKWDTLCDFIQAKFMGSDIESLEEVEKLSALRRKLLDSISMLDDNKCSKYPTNKIDLIATLRSCRFYKALISPETKASMDKIEARISTLINYIHEKHKSYEFDYLKFDYKQDNMDSIDEEPEPDLNNLDDCEKCTIFDIITLEDEESVPVLLLSTTDLIENYWINGNFSKFRTVMDCPLMVKLVDCIGHVYTYTTFKSLSNKAGYIINPLTNQRVFGGLILNEAADNWNDYVLAKTFFRGKKVDTCFALWYYIIYENANSKPWIDGAVINLLKSYAIERMKRATVRLAFSKLPLDPKEMVPLNVACFYCTEGSSFLFGESRTLFLHERLRQYWPVAKKMLDILDYFGCDVDKAFVLKRAKIFEIMTNIKRIPKEIDKRFYLLEKSFESQGPFLTYIIKDRTALQLLNLVKYHHNSMIPFDYDATPINFKSMVLVSYDNESPGSAGMVKLCSNTFRPYFAVKTDKDYCVPNYQLILSTITEVILDENGEILSKNEVSKLDRTKLLSTCKQYIDLTKILERFPTLREYAQYTWKIKKFSGNKVRLFNPQVVSDIKQYFDLYSKLGVNIDEFILRTQNSIKMFDRIKLEQTMVNDKKIDKFIAKAKRILDDLNGKN